MFNRGSGKHRFVRLVLLTFAFLYLAVLAYFKVQLKPLKPLEPTLFTVPAQFSGELLSHHRSAMPGLNSPQSIASPQVDAVKEAISHAFDGYARHAWGFDELMPVSKRGKNSFCQSGATIIDSLSTLWLAKLSDRFDKARDWALATDYSKLQSCNLFETNIRILGGLLSAGALSEDPRFYAQAKIIAELMLPSFDNDAGLPCNTFPLARGECAHANLAEAGTLVLEFAFLSHVTNDDKYQRAAERAMRSIALGRNTSSCLPGLYHSSLDTRTGRGTGSCWGSMGGGADSFYEYLLKIYLLTNQHASFLPYKQMWDLSMRSTRDNLLRCSLKRHLYIGAGDGGFFGSNLEHLACFLGGNMVLGDAQAYAQVAAAITESCVAMYTNTASGLGADGVEWVGSLPLDSCLQSPASHEHADFRISSGHNLQRPETVESLYYLWRHTGDARYRELGWAIFSKLNQTRVATGGFASVIDVNAGVLSYDDLQQSFFIAEELKYFLLLFAQPEDVPIDQTRWIFNTEAHPLPVFDPLFASSIGDVCSGAPFVCA